MRKALLFISVMLLTGSVAVAQKQWTLQDCIDYAMANNITLQKSKLQKESATEELKGAKAALLPTLSASTNQSLGYQPWKDTGMAYVTNGTVNTKVDKTSYNGSYSLSGQWTVWNGNRNINTVKLDQFSEEQAELQAQETANSIQERIAQIYSQILYLAENVKVNEQMLETSLKNEERGQEMVNVGKMSKADLAQLSAQRANDEYSIVEAKSQLMNYKLQLKQLLEITDNEQFDVAIPEISDDQVLAQIPEMQTVYEQALLSRPEIERLHPGEKIPQMHVIGYGYQAAGIPSAIEFTQRLRGGGLPELLPEHGHRDLHPAVEIRHNGAEYRREHQAGHRLHFRQVLVLLGKGILPRGGIAGRPVLFLILCNHLLASAGISRQAEAGQKHVRSKVSRLNQRINQGDKTAGMAAGNRDALRSAHSMRMRLRQFGETVGPAGTGPVCGGCIQ